MIRFQSDDIEMPVLDMSRMRRWIGAVAAGYGFTVGEINYIFCSDERELKVNRQYLGHDYYTDIITFDYSTRMTLSADIFISLETVKSNAALIGTTFENELQRVLIHGVLHLTGQGDKTEEACREMHRKEDAALEILREMEAAE